MKVVRMASRKILILLNSHMATLERVRMLLKKGRGVRTPSWLAGWPRKTEVESASSY